MKPSAIHPANFLDDDAVAAAWLRSRELLCAPDGPCSIATPEAYIAEVEHCAAAGWIDLTGCCRELSFAMCGHFPDLTPVWGWINCEHGARWPHWYVVSDCGTVHDPSRGQFRTIHGYGRWPEGQEVPLGACPGCKQLIYLRPCDRCGYDLHVSGHAHLNATLSLPLGR